MSQGAADRTSATAFKPGYYISDYTPKASEAGAGPFFGVWWTFTPTVSGTITLTTERTTSPTDAPDTVLELWQGDTLVDSNDNDDALGSLSKVAASVTAGVAYHVHVGTADESGDSVEFFVLTAELPGDELDSTLVWAVDQQFSLASVGQVFSSDIRGDLVVFACAWYDGVTDPTGYVAMKYLGNGRVTFGPAYYPPDGIGQWGAQFVRDGVFIDTVGSGGAVAGYRIDPSSLEITFAGQTTDPPAYPSRAPLVNLETGEVFVYTDDGLYTSRAQKALVSSSGSLGGWEPTWTDTTTQWVWHGKPTRLNGTTFIDGVDRVTPDGSITDNIVVVNLTNGGLPTIGTGGLAAGADSTFWRSLAGGATTTAPAGSGGRALIYQGLNPPIQFAEVKLGGTFLNVPHSTPVDQPDSYRISFARFVNNADLSVSVPAYYAKQQAEPYGNRLVYDPFGLDERYAVVLSAGRSVGGDASFGGLPDGGLYVVHQTDGGYPATDAKIRIWYPPMPEEVTAWGIPPLRQLQRGDGLGMSGVPRAIQNFTQQASLRQFGTQ